MESQVDGRRQLSVAEPALTRPLLGHVRAEEWRFVSIVILLLLAVTTAPYLYAYGTAPPDKQYLGVMFNVADHTQYFSWMRELTQAPLAANKLTPEPNPSVFFNLLWWLMGRTGHLLGLDYAAMFQVLRFVATTAFLLLVYRICAWFLPDPQMRRVAFLIATLSSGFGWVLILLKYVVGTLYYPLLVYIVEPNTFFAALSTPHLIGGALYMLAFDLVLRGEHKGQLRYGVAAGLFTQFIGWQHTYDLILVYGILGGYILLRLLRDRRIPAFLIRSGLIIGVLSAWPAFYAVWLTSAHPTWREVLAQYANAGVYSPSLPYLPVLMGPAFLLALYTLLKSQPLSVHGLDNNALFLKAWFWFTFALIYIPTDYQIKMLNGWQVPIAILATQGLFGHVMPWAKHALPRRWEWSTQAIRRTLIIAMILAVVPTNLYLWTWRFVELRRYEYPYYLYQEEVSALAWLEAHARPDDVVLASLTIGQYVPALTGTHAFLAHWAQTLSFYDKRDMVEAFFSTDDDDFPRQQLLDEFDVDYVFYGPAERLLGDYQLSDAPFLQRVYSTPLVEVYRVLHR